MRKKQKKLSTSLITVSIAFAILLSCIIGAIGYEIHKKGMMERYQSYLEGIINITMSEMDIDELARCIKNNAVSGKYEEMQKNLNNIKECFNIKYIYMVVPVSDADYDNMMYVMEGITEEEKNNSDNTYFGKYSGKEYTKKMADVYKKCMNNGGDIEYYASNTYLGYLYTAMVPLIDSNGNPVAVLSIDISMNEVAHTMQRYITGILINGIIITIIFLAIQYLWIKKRIISPINDLKIQAEYLVDSAKNISKPEELHFKEPEIKTGDEMEVFAHSLYVMEENLKKYMVNLLNAEKEKERIGAELNVATKIQADMLPRVFPPYPDYEEFDLYALMDPAKEVGGDFYDFFMIDETHLGIVIGDVSGKGVPAALFMVISKTIIKNYTMMNFSPEQVFNKANEDLCEGNEMGLFTTAWLGIYDIENGKLSFCDAGHDNPILRKKNGNIEYIKPSKKRLMLAGMEGTQYILNEIFLEEGDMVFLYTDGIPEANNVNEEFFGQKRLEEAIKESKNADSKELVNFVRKRVSEFAGDVPQFDDITMLALEIKKI